MSVALKSGFSWVPLFLLLEKGPRVDGSRNAAPAIKELALNRVTRTQVLIIHWTFFFLSHENHACLDVQCHNQTCV